MEPRPFTIAIPDDDLTDLRARLRATRWADDFGNDDWVYGMRRDWLEPMIDYWANEFEWRNHEAAMNELPHFKVEIDGVPIHFVHKRGTGPNPTPIILTHGWPWTFWDWHQLIGPLTDPAAHGGDPSRSFDVVVPSLPGFGFSEPLRTTGINPRQTATLWTTLMRDVLGYDRYAAAGGDWGAIVTAEMGHAHPDPLIGIYLTLPILPGIAHRTITEESYAPDEAWMYERAQESLPYINSHSFVHRYDSQTLAYAMVDSPVGTAAWIWERRRTWADNPTGDPVDTFGRDFLCTTASIYWLTKTIGTSFRYYREHFIPGWERLHDGRPAVSAPTAIGISPKEVVMMPRRVAAENTDLRRWHIFDTGGHFAPAENPGPLVEEYRTFFGELRNT